MKFDLSPKKLFLFLFLYALSAGLFVQLVLLPHLFPQLHAGNGLLLGNDSVRMHSETLLEVEKLNLGGFEAFAPIRPGKLMYSIVAILYWLVSPTPLAVLPLQALAHSLAALLLFILFLKLSGNLWVSFLAICPYFFSLSALNLYTQLLKEAIDNFGVFLFLVFWSLLILRPEKKNALWYLAAIGLGQLIAVYNRPYLMPLFSLFSLFAFLYLAIQFKKQNKHKEFFRWIGYLIILFAVLNLLSPKFSNPSRTEVPEMQNTQSSSLSWIVSKWMPTRLDKIFEMVSKTRDGFIYEAARGSTSIDTTVHFRSALDVIEYIPRALQIAFFSPFPNQWFSHGNLSGSKIFRAVGAVETAFFYVFLLGLAYYIFACRPPAVFWFIFLFALAVMLLQSSTIINIGTLTRHRFGYQSLLSGFGILGIWEITKRRREKSGVK